MLFENFVLCPSVSRMLFLKKLNFFALQFYELFFYFLNEMLHLMQSSGVCFQLSVSMCLVGMSASGRCGKNECSALPFSMQFSCSGPGEKLLCELELNFCLNHRITAGFPVWFLGSWVNTECSLDVYWQKWESNDSLPSLFCSPPKKILRVVSHAYVLSIVYSVSLRF